MFDGRYVCSNGTVMSRMRCICGADFWASYNQFTGNSDPGRCPNKDENGKHIKREPIPDSWFAL